MIYLHIQNCNRHYLEKDGRFFQKPLRMIKKIECHAAMHGCDLMLKKLTNLLS